MKCILEQKGMVKFMYKKIISVLSVAAILLMGTVSPASAKSVDILTLDFEDVTFEEFENMSNVTIFSGTKGDELSIEEESAGNNAFKIFRKAENVADAENKNGSNADLGFNIMLPESFSSGIVRVSFKVRTADGYKFRSRWKALGSATTSAGGYKAQFVTHSGYAYTNGTSTVVGSLNSNNWYTINYDLYIDENKVVKGHNADPSGSKINCSAGDFGGLSFIVAYTNQWWTSCNSGDLCYWVDDIKVTMNQLSVENVNITDGAEDIELDTAVNVSFDDAVASGSLTSSNFVLEKDGTAVQSNVTQSGNTVTVAPVNGLEYNSEYSFTVKADTKSVSGYALTEDYTIGFKTKSVISTSLEEGGRYTEGYIPEFTEVQGVTYNKEISVNNGDYSEYNGEALEELGNYTMKITATDENGKTEEKIIAFEIIGAVAPLAENVKITGEPIIGTELTGSYEYKDENGDAEAETTFKWYRSKEKDGEYTEIDGATGEKYTLTDADEDAYIKFSVTPVSAAEPSVGEEYFSEAFVSAMNPKAENIKVEGTIAEGNELSVSYDYFDENGDEENESIITWYAMESETGEAKNIGNGEKYTLSENDTDHYIKVGIMPKNAGSGKQDTEFFSEVITGAFKPVAEDVKIIGNLKAGSSVGVDYKYSDKNSDPEGDTKISWYVDGNVVSTNESYTITSSDKGKKIYVEVTPVSTAAPFDGDVVSSKISTISSSAGTTVSSGGKNTGGGSGGGGTGSTSIIVPINPDVVENAEKNEVVTEEFVFTDILNHWAKNEILEMAEKGVINGKAEKTFAPDDNIKRAEFAAIIARAFELEEGENVFSDIDNDAWYNGAVSAVTNAGFMKGADGRFRPDDNITRQEIAVVLANISRTKGLNTTADIPVFEDAGKVADWAKADVEYVTSLGLLNGISTGYFAPLSDATRAQVVVILTRLLEQ